MLGLIYNFGSYSYVKGYEYFGMAASVASKLHTNNGFVSSVVREPRGAQPPSPMARDLQSRFFAVLLALAQRSGHRLCVDQLPEGPRVLHPVRRRLVGGGRRTPARPAGGRQRSGRKSRRQEGRPAGRGRWPRHQQRRQPGAAVLPHRRLVQDHLLAGAPGNPSRSAADSGSCRSFALRRSAADCAGLSRHWIVRPAAPLDRSQEHALLRLLPGVVHFLLVPLHRQAQRL